MALHRSAFDLAGRLVEQVEADGTTTQTAFAFDPEGWLVKTTTYAVGSAAEATRSETYCRYGSIVSIG